MNSQTPVNNSPHLAALAASATDIRAAMGMCDLMSKTLQLLPLRYALVERLDPSSALDMPFRLSSHPVGIRLLRDGYLYLIDNGSGYLHEYQIEQGRITKLLWQDNEVAADVRTSSVGEPHLIFKRHTTLYACYSEIQWTAFKCSQVLKDPSERGRVMQLVEPGIACPVNGGANLLSQQQVEQWLAEVAETPSSTEPPHRLPEGAHPEESQPYSWEAQTLFQNTPIHTLTSQVLAPYQNDYVYLVLRDDFGVMRDLAQEQLKISDWIGHWSADEDVQRKYLTGSYIQSLYGVNASRLDQISAVDPAVKALKDQTSPAQQALIYVYLEAMRNHQGPVIYAPEQILRGLNNLSDYHRARLAMQDGLGETLWRRHEDTIYGLAKDTWDALDGTLPGQPGIDDLTHRVPMQDFVVREQTLLNHWHARLKRVREDRLKMITEGYFHRAAWYYDFTLDTQIKHRLETEFLCVAAICENREMNEKLAAYLEKNLLTLIPGLETLHLRDQTELAKKLADLSSFTIGVLESGKNIDNVSGLANQFNSLMNERLPNYALLNTRFQGMQSMLEGAYNPAFQLKLSSELDKAQNAFRLNQHVQPNEFIRNSGSAVRIQLLREFARSGLTVRGATVAEIRHYTETRDTALQYRSSLKDLYQERKKALNRQLYGLEPVGSEERINRSIIQVKAALEPLEERLTLALTPGSGSPAQIGTVVDGWSPEVRAELNRTVRDFRATGTFAAPMRSVLSSKGDWIALTLVVFQGLKLIEVLGASRPDNVSPWDELKKIGEASVGFIAVSTAATQGLAVTVFQAHIQQMESVAGKLNAMSRLGRWVGFSGIGAFTFGVINALVDVGKHSQQWGEALATGNHKALVATTLQLTGDGILVGTNVWGLRHTTRIVQQVMSLSSELRALAWAQASPKLLSIAVRVNLVGLIATALQLAGEGLYNFFHRDAMQKWLETSVWGTQSLQRSLQDDWSALARVVQQPTCELIRAEKKTFLRFVLPGIRTRELDSRQLQLLVYQRQTEKTTDRPYGSHSTARWHERSAAWAGMGQVASEEDEALVVQIPIPENLQNSDFSLALSIGYQLEAERALIHRTFFIVKDMRIITGRGHRAPLSGRFKLKAVEALPEKLGADKPWLIQRDELEKVDA